MYFYPPKVSTHFDFPTLLYFDFVFGHQAEHLLLYHFCYLSRVCSISVDGVRTLTLKVKTPIGIYGAIVTVTRNDCNVLKGLERLLKVSNSHQATLKVRQS